MALLFSILEKNDSADDRFELLHTGEQGLGKGG